MKTDIRLDDDNVEIIAKKTKFKTVQQEPATVQINHSYGNITLGGNAQDGDLAILNRSDKHTIHLNGNGASLHLGTESIGGNCYIYDQRRKQTIKLDGNSASIRLGESGQGGDVLLQNNDGDTVIRMHADDVRVNVGDILIDGASSRIIAGKTQINGSAGSLRLGGMGNDGELAITNDANREAIHLNGQNATLKLGRTGTSSQILLKDTNGDTTVSITAERGEIRCHGKIHCGSDIHSERFIANSNTGLVDLVQEIEQLQLKVNQLGAGVGDLLQKIQQLETKVDQLHNV